MMPERERTTFAGRASEAGGRLYRPVRCSICTRLIWSRPVAHQEPVEAPEPRQAWLLCRSCHEALLVEMRRSSIQSPVRLRIAVGLVAAERSPRAYMSARMRMQREFAWAIWFLVLFALLHLVILVVLFAAPR